MKHLGIIFMTVEIAIKPKHTVKIWETTPTIGLLCWRSVLQFLFTFTGEQKPLI